MPLLAVAVVLGVAAPALLSSDCDALRSPSATIALPTIGEPVKIDLPLSAGTRLSFAMYAEEAHYGQRPRDSLWLHVELLDGDEMVLDTRCVGIDGRHGKGTAVQTTFHGGDGCEITVPEPGTKAMRATVTFGKDGASLDLDGLALKVFTRQGEG